MGGFLSFCAYTLSLGFWRNTLHPSLSTCNAWTTWPSLGVLVRVVSESNPDFLNFSGE